jgi:hypothetical protein
LVELEEVVLKRTLNKKLFGVAVQNVVVKAVREYQLSPFTRQLLLASF